MRRRSDPDDAQRVILAAEGEAAVESWDIERLTNADLVTMALLGISLNRTGRVPYAVQLHAISLIHERIEGKTTDKPSGDDGDKKPLMSVEEFRRAVMLPTPSPRLQPTETPEQPVTSSDIR
jgi:NAD(P)H-hydrate repair Nnr-like enzyme with NAD(P)H-hydrate epimerase domain